MKRKKYENVKGKKSDNEVICKKMNTNKIFFNVGSDFLFFKIFFIALVIYQRE